MLVISRTESATRGADALMGSGGVLFLLIFPDFSKMNLNFTAFVPRRFSVLND